MIRWTLCSLLVLAAFYMLGLPAIAENCNEVNRVLATLAERIR